MHTLAHRRDHAAALPLSGGQRPGPTPVPPRRATAVAPPGNDLLRIALAAGLRARELSGRRVLFCPDPGGAVLAEACRLGADALAIGPPACAEEEPPHHRRRDGRPPEPRRQPVPHGQQEPHRHLEGELPQLALPAGCFDLAVSSGLLFGDGRLDLGDHLAAALELLRITRGEVRIVGTSSRATGRRSARVDPLVHLLRGVGFRAALRVATVPDGRGTREVERVVVRRPVR